ncbi:hypothetical protein BD324DRAFT_610768 [Kockovaella imperatae]|uniref:ubiquitinyl hydrolase 1 n=1 Tax=Kockovaella imperatae TaxID=4999 RepID=A0A1Y1UQX4_9TREE|nr:hypothetical protein BD324DRAFT_610768 [Kockovaella imperatae]ORX40453.1 hypothetical protein BD324DRAFT_610768 [Kockovaella imperatae]
MSSLKRPRSHPPSPTTSSSSKRAASEDPLSTDLPESPDSARTAEPEDPNWVQKTQDFHLESDPASMDVDKPENKYKSQYDSLLNEISPPFTPWTLYYLLPSAFLNDIKHAALGDGDPDLKLDLSPLVLSPIKVCSYVHPKSFAVDQDFWPIRAGLQENDDFVYISSAGWQKIVEWYPYDGPVLPRWCLPGDTFEIAPKIYTLHIFKRTNDQPAFPTVSAPLFTCPSVLPLKDLHAVLHALYAHLRQPRPETRLWTFAAPPEPIVDLVIDPAVVIQSASTFLDQNITCAEAGLEQGDQLALEFAQPGPIGTMWAVDSDGGKAAELNLASATAPPPLFSKPAFFGGSGESSQGVQTRSSARKVRGKGLVGLVNLGNTCFMNSAVQCLSNTVELKDYFLSGVYKSELNADNPLGMGGKVAENFGATIEALWTQPESSFGFSPRQLKYTTSRFAPQFAGYGQHDTQEFIAFLLDGLHEDLNRIHKKPYIEKPDWKPGGGDKELALLGKECWDGYKKRNDSVIVDLFQGQLKSTLVCPVCTKESITLDPFMYLTVPLPIAQTRIFKCHFVPLDPEKLPCPVRLLIPQNASFMQVKEKLGSLFNCDAKKIIGFDLWKGAVYAWWLDADHNSACKDSDEAVFYELAVEVKAGRSVGHLPGEAITVPVYTLHSVDGHQQTETSQPFFITLSKAEAADPVLVREAITRGYSRLIRPEMRSKMWTSSGSSRAARAIPHMGDDSEEPDEHPSGPLAPRGDLFKVHVAEAESGSSLNIFKGKDDVIPFYKGGLTHAAGTWSLLESRRKPKKNMFGHITTGIKSIVGHGSDDEGSPATTPLGPPVAVRPGEGIFCEWPVKKFSEFFDATRLADAVVDPAIAKEAEKRKNGRSISLEDCLDEFSKEETLGQDDLWYCPQCKKHQAATKKLEIYQAPDILVICIKRFGSSRRLHDKLDNMVNFPIDGLDLTERVGERQVAKTLHLNAEQAKEYGMQSDDQIIYDLYAVDNHFGGLGGGHYTAFCKNAEDGRWYNYDDSRVSPASPDAVQSKAAYLLFYRRRTDRLIGGISRIKAEEASRAVSPIPSEADDTPSSGAVTPSTPAPPSPTLSSRSSVDSRPPDLDWINGTLSSDVKLAEVGSAIGYGNDAWKTKDEP